MKILWTLITNTKEININSEYPEYDDKNLSSEY